VTLKCRKTKFLEKIVLVFDKTSCLFFVRVVRNMLFACHCLSTYRIANLPIIINPEKSLCPPWCFTSLGLVHLPLIVWPPSRYFTSIPLLHLHSIVSPLIAVLTAVHLFVYVFCIIVVGLCVSACWGYVETGVGGWDWLHYSVARKCLRNSSSMPNVYPKKIRGNVIMFIAELKLYESFNIYIDK